MFRRTVATVINDQASVNLAAQLLGHTDPKEPIERYIRRNEQVNPLTAELLDAAFGPDIDLLLSCAPVFCYFQPKKGGGRQWHESSRAHSQT